MKKTLSSAASGKDAVTNLVAMSDSASMHRQYDRAQ